MSIELSTLIFCNGQVTHIRKILFDPLFILDNIFSGSG